MDESWTRWKSQRLPKRRRISLSLTKDLRLKKRLSRRRWKKNMLSYTKMYNDVHIGITDDTTPEDLDRYFTIIWRRNQKVNLIFDTTQCDNISLRRALGMKSLLN